MVSNGDNFRIQATAIVILILFSKFAFADFDLSLGTTTRSYPLGGGVEANAGYGILLWGDPNVPWYGYVRPRIDGQTAATYNSISASLEVYPLSILGFRAGGEAVQNDADYSAHDCQTYQCRGRFYNSFAQGELALGYGPVFAQGRWRRERWTKATSSSMAFIDPEAGLALAGTGDSKTYYRGMIGYKVNEKWTIAGAYIYIEADSDHGISRFPFAIVRYKSGDFSVAAGGGVFSSKLKPESGSALLFLTWDIWPSIALK